MTIDLFSTLLKLHSSPFPEEDFFTKIIAWLFSAYPELLFTWMKDCMEIDNHYSKIFIKPHENFESINGLEGRSKPDIVIELGDGSTHDIMFIESKIKSKEGKDQLIRYAEQLSNYPDVQNRYLVYITRKYEPKNFEQLTQNYPTIRFIQLRWYQFYEFLEYQPTSQIIDEVLKFMRDKQMTQITRITPGTLQAFKSIPKLLDFFDAVFVDDIQAEFSRVFRKPQKPYDELIYRRYCLTAWVGDWNFQLGFWMPDVNEKGLPLIGALFELNADLNIKKWNSIAKLFRQIMIDSADSQFAWKGESLNEPNTWGYIALWTPFEEILTKANHTEAVKVRLSEYLKEAERIKKSYLKIPERQRKIYK